MSETYDYKVSPPTPHLQAGQSCVSRIGTSLITGFFSGVFVGSAFLAWYPDPYEMAHKGTVKPRALGMRYFLTGLRGPVGWMMAVCGTFSAVDCLVENIRTDKESTYVNSGIAGAAAGALIGSRAGRIDTMASTALLTGIALAVVDYNGRTYTSDETHAHNKWDKQFIPGPTYKESTTVQELKEKYPEYKNL